MKHTKFFLIVASIMMLSVMAPNEIFGQKNKFIWMYNSDIHPKQGKNTYYVHIEVFDAETDKEIGRSDDLTFTMTGK